MPRPPLPLGTWGKIARVQLGEGRWAARARFRDVDGRTRRVEAHGKTGAAAERALLLSLRGRTSADDANGVTGDLRLSRLCALWFAELEGEMRVKPQTLDRYRGIINHSIVPALGELRVRELSVSVTDRFLKAYAARSPAQAQSVKQVLGQIMGLAVRHDAIAINPVRNVSRLRTTKRTVRALDQAELEAVRVAVRAWRAGEGADGRRPLGPRPSGDLADIIDVTLGTGLRINEVLAIRWCDVELDAARPTLTVTGTLVQLKDAGIVRQDSTKSAAGLRTLFLPGFVFDVLRRRRAKAPANGLDAVFATRNGTWVSAHNVRRQWRAIRGEAGLEWVTPHAFRKTVATIIEREFTSKGAAAQLGHASEAITESYYVEKNLEAPDFTRVLDRLGPQDPTHG